MRPSITLCAIRKFVFRRRSNAPFKSIKPRFPSICNTPSVADEKQVPSLGFLAAAHVIDDQFAGDQFLGK